MQSLSPMNIMNVKTIDCIVTTNPVNGVEQYKNSKNIKRNQVELKIKLT